MPPKSGGGKKSKAAKQVTNKRRRGFIDPDLRVSKRQERKDDAKFVKAKFGNFQGGDDAKRRAETESASASSSEDEDLENALGRRPPRQRTHVFKNFAQRVAEVDLDVHRTAGALRVDPLQGSACFFHETLVKCAELNCGAHFSDFKREAEPLCQSLPMLVLHQDEVLRALLSRLVPEARHSLEALLSCLQALARDLRGDFEPKAFELSVNALATLMQTDIAREPEILEHAFQSLAFMCKWLQRPLAGDLCKALRKTKKLRRHTQAHVRVFAAQAVAFLLRVAPDANDNVAKGVRALLAEAASAGSSSKETEADLHGAGALLAEAAKGAAHGLHSRAERVLRVALRPGRVGKSVGPESERKEKDSETDDVDDDDDDDAADARLARASAVAEHAVAALCKHTRRGKCSRMWSMLLGAARRAARETCAGAEDKEDKDKSAADSEASSDEDEEDETVFVGKDETDSALCRRAARAHDVVACAVETYRGARVEDYRPLFALLEKHTFPALRRARDAALQNQNQNQSGKTVGARDVAIFAAAARRLCLALADAHDVVAGASLGPESIRDAAKSWSAAVTHVAPAEAFAFLEALNDRSRRGSEAATAALNSLLPAAAPALVALVERGPTDYSYGAVDADAAATLLGDVCDALLSSERNAAGTDRDDHTSALLARASPPAAAAIVARARSASSSAKKEVEKTSSRRKKMNPGETSLQEPVPPARRRWAMLRLVPHCDRGPEAWSATSEAAEWALGVLEGTGTPLPYALGDDDRETKACLAAALASRAALVSFSARSSEDAGESREQRRRDTVRFALRAVRAAGDCPGVVQAAADALGGVRAADPESAARETRRFHEERDGDGEKDVSPSPSSPSPSHAPLYSSLSVLGDALRAPSRHARFAALAFLCEMSASTGECGEADVTADTVSAGDTPTSLGSILRLFKDVNARDAADAAKSGVMEYAKTSQVAIASVIRAVEGDAFKPEWARWTALCALGATRLRLATLWPALIKLLGAASARAALEPAWEALFSSLEGAQRECLDAHDAATGAAKTSRGAVKTGGRRRGWIEARGEDEDEDEDGDEEKNGDEDDDDVKDKAADDDEDDGVVAATEKKREETGSAAALRTRALDACFPEEQGVDRWTRFSTLLRCVAGSPQAAARHPLPLAKLFLRFDAPRADGTRRSGKAWRNGLREWLKLFQNALSGGRAVKALEHGVGDGVRASLERHVSADESDLASSAIKCLGQWRLPHLSPENAERLARVADEKTMKLELINLRLTDEADEGPGSAGGGAHACVTAEHRPAFASLVVRCLLPRLKKRSGRHAPLRAAALAWIGRLDPIEIAPLVHAVVAPLEGGASSFGGEEKEKHAWSDLVRATGAGDARAKASWLAAARDAKLYELVRSGSKRPEGFVRAAHDLLKAAGEHAGAYLDALVAIASELLAEASALCESAADNRERLANAQSPPLQNGEGVDKNHAEAFVASKEAKEVRVMATRFLASAFERHPDFDYAPYWPSIARSVAPMLARAANESSAASAAPPAVALVASVASDDACAKLLLEDAVVTSASSSYEDAKEKINVTSFLESAWRALGARHASGATRACALGVAESLVERAETWRLARSEARLRNEGDGVAAALLRAHAPALLEALRNALAARASPDRRGGGENDAGTDAAADGTQTANGEEADVETAAKGATANGENGNVDDPVPRESSSQKKRDKRLAAPSKRRGAKSAAAGAAGRELELLKRLGPLLGRAAASAAVADVLIPVLAVRRLDESAAAEVLAAFAAVAPAPRLLVDASIDGVAVDEQDAESMRSSAASHAAALAPLFGRLRTRHARRALCAAFEAVGAWDAGARVAAALLNRLHAESRVSIDGVDYDARLDAYDALDVSWFRDAPASSAAPIAHHVLHELRGKDMALRHAAAAALERMLDAAVGGAKTLSRDASSDAGGVEDVDDDDETDARKTSAGGDASTPEDLERKQKNVVIATLGDVVMRVVAPGVRGLLRAPDQTTRAEAIGAFRKLAEAAPSAAPGAFASLADPSDPEKDFFANAAHLQAHRRARALRLLSAVAVKTADLNEELMETSPDESVEKKAKIFLPASVIVGYLAPLATAALGDPGADVASTAASAVGALAGALPWGPYRDLLHATLRKASAGRGGRDGRGYDVEGSKALHIRAAATILERFHEFDLDAETRAERETGAPAVATNVVGRLIHPSVVECLRLDVLPKLEALAVVEDNEGKGGTVRPAAAAATVAVLRLLPARDLEYDISRVLGKMANCLRSRAQGVRDSARAALASASAGLGAAHLPSVVSLLTTRLDRGFMVHVLGATLHSILDATIKTEHAEDVNPETDPEDVDDALEEIIPVLDADVFGRAAQEREEVAAIRGAYKEARRSRAHECLTLLAASASMPDALPKLLAPVTKRLHAASLPSLRVKIEAYAQAVAKGVLRNPRLSPEATLVLVYSVINDGVTRDERVAATESSMKLEETKLGEAKRGQKETGNRVWENGWFLIKLPAPGSDRFVLEDAGPAAGDRYKKAKYGDDETSDAGDGGPAATGIAALAGSAEDVPPNFEILVVFALGLLRAMLRKMSGEKGVGGKAGDEQDDAAEEADAAGDASPRGLSKQRRAILEGVVPLMARCLSSPHAAVPPLATRCLAQLSTMRLGAFDASTGALARRIMALLRECPRPGDPLAQDCMKLLNNLLKRHGNFTPTEAQFRFLVTFCFGDLEADQGEAHRSTTFALMRAVLARRPLLPEVYDVMKTVSSLVVRAGAAETRALCSQALVQFLLDYPLGERRLRQHIDLIAANLEYVYASGRQSALRCVRDLSVRFPKDVVATHAPFLFVPLVARLGADEDAACRKGAGEALHALLKRVSSERSEKDGEFGDASNDGVVKKLLSLCVGWLNVAADSDSDAISDPRLARAAMQTLGIATSASPRAAASATRAARRRVVALMEAHDPSRGANERDDDDVAVGWQTAYHALLLVEKMSASCPKALESESNVDDAFAAVSKTPFGKAEDARLDHPDAPWRAAQALLQHRHQWVQQAAARVVGRYLAAHGAAMAREMTSLTGAKSKADDALSSRETSFLARPVSLETVARASVAVLEQGAGAGAAELDEGLAEQTVKNLTFASAVLLRAAPSDADAASLDAEDASISSSDDEIEHAEDGTSLTNGRETSTVGRDGDASKETRVKRPPLPWLFRRVGKVGAGGVGAARAGALKFTAALGSGLGANGFARNPSVAAPLLLPAALCVDDAVKGVDEAHRDLAAQVLEVLRDAMPGDLFSRASAETRARIVGRRDARRKRKALEAVTDPERAARAKIVKSQKRAAARKRRVGEFRAGKGSGPEGAKKRARDV